MSFTSYVWQFILDDGRGDDTVILRFDSMTSRKFLLQQLKSFNWKIPLAKTLLETFPDTGIVTETSQSQKIPIINLTS